jgi:hypothetical protein
MKKGIVLAFGLIACTPTPKPSGDIAKQCRAWGRCIGGVITEITREDDGDSPKGSCRVYLKNGTLDIKPDAVSGALAQCEEKSKR